MSYSLPKDRMPEAEVSLRLTFYLLKLPGCHGDAEVAIDGAQVRVHGKKVFPIEAFLLTERWQKTKQEGKNPWQGTYEKCGKQLVVHARSGIGDVIVKIGDRRVRTECKGGPLIKKRGSPEYQILREGLGQIITAKNIQANDLLATAVPDTPPFRNLVQKWQRAPLITKAEIRLLLVHRDGTVRGLENVIWR